MTIDRDGRGAEDDSSDRGKCAEQATRCRRLASATYDRGTAAMLEQMASEFERHAAQNDR